MVCHHHAKCGGHRYFSSRDVMVLVCHVISKNHLIKVSCDFMDGSASRLMLSHHPAKFGGHRHCGSGDKMFLVAEVEDCRCFHFHPPLTYISKGYDLKAHGIY